MKKLFLVCFVAVIGFVSAQEAEETLKPQANDYTAEFVLNGGLDNTSVGFREGGIASAAIRGRYFTSEKTAYRGSIYLNTLSTNDDDTDGSSSETTVDLGFGLEKHFDGTKRLSPYYGGELYLGYTSVNEEVGADETDHSEFGVGLRGVFGADYYFVQNVYLGVEAGLGLEYKSVGETEVNGTTVSEGGSEFGIAPIITGLKIGFVF